MTFTGFDGKGDGEGLKRLDYVHLGVSSSSKAKRTDTESCEGPGDEVKRMLKENRDKLSSYTVLSNMFDDGVRFSDHRAVVVDLLL